MLQQEALADIVTVAGAEAERGADEKRSAGLALARTAGDLWAAGDIINLMNMPVLATFLELRGERLQRVAVDMLQRSGQAEAIARAMGASGADTAPSAQDAAHGVARRVAAEAMAERIEEVALAGAGLLPEEIVQS
jgi:hypothetical protein